MTASFALGGVALLFTAWPGEDPATVRGARPAALASLAAPLPQLSAQSIAGDTTPARRVYRHSVVPGGVRTPAEVVRAMAADPVVAAHYAGVDTSRLRVERLTQPLSAHVSYRIGDKVLWTGRKLLLAAGEEVLTDGTTTLRARCGNMISTIRRTPTFAGEPEEAEFEQTTDPPRLDALALTTAPNSRAFRPDLASASLRDAGRNARAVPAPGALVLPGFMMVAGVMGYLCRRKGRR